MTAALAVSAPAGAEAQAPRIVGSPLATIGRYPDSGRPFFLAYVRLTQPVPRNSSGVLLGAMSLNGLGPDEPPAESSASSFGFGSLTRHAGRYCYTQGFVGFGYDQYPKSLRRAKIDDRVRVEVWVTGLPKPLVGSTRLRTRLKVTEQAAARRLGCLGSQ